jgi:hypothetical protein
MTILQDGDTEYTPVFLYSMDDSALEIIRLLESSDNLRHKGPDYNRKKTSVQNELK